MGRLTLNLRWTSTSQSMRIALILSLMSACKQPQPCSAVVQSAWTSWLGQHVKSWQPLQKAHPCDMVGISRHACAAA